MTEDWRTHGEFVRLKDCRKKHGRLNTNAFCLSALVIALFNLSAYSTYLTEDNPMPLIGGMCLVLFLLCAGLAYFQQYFERNIIGYDLWIYRVNESCPEHRVLAGQIFKRGIRPNIGACALVVPLGGWLNKKRIWFGKDSCHLVTLHPYWKLHNFFFREHGELPGSVAAIKTCHGEKIQMDALHFLDMLEILRGVGGGSFPPGMPVGMVLKNFMIVGNELEAAAETNQTKVNQLFDLLVKIAKDIDDTKRFGKSKEGARIREQLVAEILKLMPADDSRRKILESAKPAA